MLRTTRRALIVLGLLGLLARALVPVGLMPAPASAGGPLVFCHGGAAGAFFRALAAAGVEQPATDGGAHDYHAAVEAAQPHAGRQHLEHHAGHHSGDLDQVPSTPLAPAASDAPLGSDGPAAGHLAWENCSFTGAFAHAALAPIFDLPLLALEHARALPAPRAHVTTATAPRYWARGPPLGTT